MSYVTFSTCNIFVFSDVLLSTVLGRMTFSIVMLNSYLRIDDVVDSVGDNFSVFVSPQIHFSQRCIRSSFQIIEYYYMFKCCDARYMTVIVFLASNGLFTIKDIKTIK